MKALGRRELMLRFLVFLCFFNFSGLNNGTTYLTAVSPLNVRDSVSLTAAAAKTFYQVMAPADLFHFLGQSHRWITRSTVWTASLFASCLKASPSSVSNGSIVDAGLEATSGLGRGQSLDSGLKSLQIFSVKNDSYLEQKKLDFLSRLGEWERVPLVCLSIGVTGLRRISRPLPGGYSAVFMPHVMRARSNLSSADGEAPSFVDARFSLTDSYPGIGFFMAGEKS